MPTRTKPAWYAHCWMFCLSQLECPLTGLGVELECTLAQLTDPGKDTGLYKFSRAFSLVSLSRAKASHRPSRFSLATRMTSWNVIASSSDFSELPVISVTFFIIIWIVFCYYLVLFFWIENMIIFLSELLTELFFKRFWFALFLVATCYCKRSVNIR